MYLDAHEVFGAEEFSSALAAQSHGFDGTDNLARQGKRNVVIDTDSLQIYT